MQTVLIVDDDPNVLILLSELLRRLFDELGLRPMEILTAFSGREAIHILNQRQIDLLITDYHMPGMNGLDLIRSIQGGPIEMRKILMSSDHLLIEEMIQAAEEGIDIVLEKPVNREKLKRVLERMFR